LIDELMNHIKAPDLTGGIIYGYEGVKLSKQVEVEL
jgi:hypothetical protein